MRILFLSRWFPFPPDNGSKIRIFNLIRSLARHHHVSLLTFAEPGEIDDVESRHTLNECCEVLGVIPYREFRPRSSRAVSGFFSVQPRFLVDTFSQDMASATVLAGRTGTYDVVVASQLSMAPYATLVSHLPAVLEELELSVFRDAIRGGQHPLRRLRSLLTWVKLTGYLRRTLPRFVACTVASDVEREHVRQVVPALQNVAVIPNAVDCAHYEGDFGVAQPNSVVFAGALTYAANYDAMRYFLGEIFPSIACAEPSIVCRITGSNRGVDLHALPTHPGVCFTGYVPDVRPVVAQSWASVVPLRVGGGTRLKILESMALGTPVVSTSKGAEGLDVTKGQDILIADDPMEFAFLLETLLHSPAQRGRLSEAAGRLVRTKYDWDVVGRGLNDLIEQNTQRESVR